MHKVLLEQLLEEVLDPRDQELEIIMQLKEEQVREGGGGGGLVLLLEEGELDHLLGWFKKKTKLLMVQDLDVR